MKLYLSAFKYIKRNFISLIMTEVLFLLVATCAIKPLISLMFKLCLKAVGISYVSQGNLIRFLTNPATIGVILVDAFLLTSLVLLHTFVLVEFSKSSRFNTDFPLVPSLYQGFLDLLRVFRPENLRLLPIALLFIPITGIPLFSSSIQGNYIPEFLSYYIRLYPTPFIALFLMYCMILLGFRYVVYALHFFCICDLNAKQSIENSRALYRAHREPLFRPLILGILIYIAVYVGTNMGWMTLFANLANKLSVRSTFSIAILSAISIITKVVTSFIDHGLMPVMVCVISASFFSLIAADDADQTWEKLRLSARNRFSGRLVLTVLTVTAIAACTVSVWNIAHGSMFDIHYSFFPYIMAHRGYAVDTTENTLTAFQNAIDANVGYIELDVQQSVDGVVFVYHDTTLKRLGGVSLRPSLLSYDIVSGFEIGRDANYIPTLEEVMILCQDKIALNIEIKPNNGDTDLIEQVVALMHKYGFAENSMITSNRYSVLEKVKAIDPNIQTGYIMSVALGSVEGMACADVFSVESVFVNKTLVNRIHAAGKSIAVWTVNTRESLLGMTELGVDYLITDKVELAKDVVYSQEFEESWMRSFYNWLSDLMK